MSEAVFAIPGDKDRRTGGFIYEATVLRVLNEVGCSTAHLQLPDSFPNPTPQDMDATLSLLRSIEPETPIILDGLVFGAIDPEGLASVKAPVVAMIHHPLGLEAGLDPSRAAFLKQNEASALRYAAHTIVPSAETAKTLVTEFGGVAERITIAPPGFHRPPVNLRPETPPLILSVGLLAPRKGHDILIDALASITDLAWQAEIVGKQFDPSFAADLHAQKEHTGLADRISFLGEIGTQDLIARFNAASIFALATRYEGYGMVLSEAMLYGLPLVSCRTGAVPDTVGDAGILVPPEDSEAFAGALRQLLTEPNLARLYGERALQAAQSLPSWDDTAAIFMRVILTLSAGRP